MAIKIKNVNQINSNVKFTYSLFFEMILCLSLLADPVDFSHKQWAMEIRKNIPRESLEIIKFWGSFDRWLFLLDIIIKGDLFSIKDSSQFFNYLNELPKEEFFDTLWEKPLAWQEKNEEEYRSYQTENYKRILRTPVKYINDLKNFLMQFFHTTFIPYSQQIELALVQSINEELSYFASHGVEKFFLRLSKKFSVKDGTLIMDSWINKTFEPGKNLDQIILIPNMLSAPHFLANHKEVKNILFIVYPLQSSPFLEKTELSYAEIDYLTGAFRVLSDTMRFNILLYLHNKPKCNQDIAHELNLPKSTVSKHLSQLRLYGFISGKDIGGNRILYSVNVDRVTDLLKQLNQILDKNRL